MKIDHLIRGGTVVTADARFAADVVLRDGRIEAVLAPGQADGLAPDAVTDASGCYVLPGAIDAHVHLQMRTPAGLTADDWLTGTRAAALGGTTTLVDFVETDPGQPLLGALRLRLEEARPAAIDYRLHMTMQPDEAVIDGVPRRISAARLGQMTEAYAAGCRSFKIYTAYPGMQIGDADVLRVMQRAAALDALVCVHAENGDMIEVLRAGVGERRADAIHHALTRPPNIEHEAVTRVLAAAEASGARTLIFHMGCDAGVQALLAARARGVTGVYGETCPQYLALSDDSLRREDGRLWICAPPLRPAADQSALWAHLRSGGLDIVSTDHCPFTRAQKDLGRVDFAKTPGGVPGIEIRLGLLHELGVRAGRLSLSEWVRVCCTRPAQLHGLPGKGVLAPGYDADVVVFDPAAEKDLTPRQLNSAIDWSAYDGQRCRGWTRDVFLRGKPIVRGGAWAGAAGDGRIVG